MSLRGCPKNCSLEIRGGVHGFFLPRVAKCFILETNNSYNITFKRLNRCLNTLKMHIVCIFCILGSFMISRNGTSLLGSTRIFPDNYGGALDFFPGVKGRVPQIFSLEFRGGPIDDFPGENVNLVPSPGDISIVRSLKIVDIFVYNVKIWAFLCREPTTFEKIV